MKKIIGITVLYVFVVTSLAFAQIAQVVDTKGKVRFRENTASKWQKVEVGLRLKGGAEIKTGRNGKCVIAFGRDRKNIITIEKNTKTVIENLKPGKVFLPKGRVFTIIRDLEQIENFEVRTPTAVSGARGTGWMTEFIGGVTNISVFEDNVFVTSLDWEGDPVAEFDIKEEYTVSIPFGGERRDLERVSEHERNEWNDAAETMERFIDSYDPRDYPGGPHDDHMIEKMRESGNYTEEEIIQMQQMMEAGFENMTSEEMMAMMEIMGEVGGMTPEEEAMMQEVMENMEAIEEMSPEEREAYMHEMEERYGVDVMGEMGEMTLEEEAMRMEMMENEGAIMEMSPEEREAYMQEMEEKYGVEGMYQDGGYPEGGGDFERYMQQFDPSMEGQFPGGMEGMYSMEGMEGYFGEFDQAWYGEGGFYVGDYFQYHRDEFYEDIYDPPPCECPIDCSLTAAMCPPPP